MCSQWKLGLIGVVIILALGQVQLYGGDNLLNNPGFESNNGGGSWAYSWGNTEEAGVEGWASHTGSWGMALVTWRGDGTGFVYQDVAIDSDTSYELRVWGQRDPGYFSGSFVLKVRWFNYGTYLAEDTLDWDVSSSGWAEGVLPLRSPAAANYARVMIGGIDIDRVGKFDDVSFKVASPKSVTASGHDSRIDLVWERDTGVDGHNIYRASTIDGVYVQLNTNIHDLSVFSDFLGVNDVTNFYRVTSVRNGDESDMTDPVSAASYSMTDEEFLTSVQEATFRYFWDYGHPVSGLIMEGYNQSDDHTPDTCAAGGTGFGLMAICVGVERGFVSREDAAERVLTMLTFLDEDADRFHGAWSHWINGSTGEAIPFTPGDDGGDVVETAFLCQGILAARGFFDGTNDVETAIRSRATTLWHDVDWYWYLRRSEPGYENNERLSWHWSPNSGWAMNMTIEGYNESLIIYLLAIASPTHPIPVPCYYNGWARGADAWYANGAFFYGDPIRVGWDLGGPLFFTHYSFMGFDPRDKNDRYANYFENSRNIAQINRAYCIDNPQNHVGYSSNVWGLTASFDPWGYDGHHPDGSDNGTITPSGAISSMPYTPAESIAAMKHMYHTYGANLWSHFGFVDAFHLGENWYASGHIAIDQAPIVVMIENYRSQLCWDSFMANSEIQSALDAIGWVRGKRAADGPTNVVSGLEYEYFEGLWWTLPDFDSLTPVATGTVDNFDLSPRLRNDEFAFRFKGYIDIPADGGYTFYTQSDDGSKLYIGDQLVVDNDGAHGADERSGYIALEAGRHPITVTYFEAYGGEVLNVRYMAEDVQKTAVPDSMLNRDQ